MEYTNLIISILFIILIIVIFGGVYLYFSSEEKQQTKENKGAEIHYREKIIKRLVTVFV